jgi:hypothetical protein
LKPCRLSVAAAPQFDPHAFMVISSTQEAMHSRIGNQPQRQEFQLSIEPTPQLFWTIAKTREIAISIIQVRTARIFASNRRMAEFSYQTKSKSSEWR